MELFQVESALANNPPGPHLSLPLFLILPVMILCTHIAGAYPLLKNGERWKSAGRIFGAFLLTLMSLTHEGFAMLFLLIFGFIALTRVIRLLGFALFHKKEYPSRKRLFGGAFLLAVVILFFGGAVVAFSQYPGGVSMYHQVRKKGQYEKMKELMLLQYQSRETGRDEGRKVYIPPEDQKIREIFAAQINKLEVTHVTAPSLHIIIRPLRSRSVFHYRLGYNDDRSDFYIDMIPRLPFFPYNLLVSEPSYIADSSGKIRMQRVQWPDTFCPLTADVVEEIDLAKREFEKRMLEDTPNSMDEKASE